MRVKFPFNSLQIAKLILPKTCCLHFMKFPALKWKR